MAACFRNLFWITLLPALLLLPGCRHEVQRHHAVKKQSAVRDTTENEDYLKHSLDYLLKNNLTEEHRFYIVSPVAKVFADSSLKEQTGILRLADTVRLFYEDDYPGYLEPNQAYGIRYNSGKEILEGYISGKALAEGFTFDDSGKQYILAAHYLSYSYEKFSDGDSMENFDNPGEILLIHDSTILKRFPLEGYNRIYFSSASNLGFQPDIRLIDVHHGLDACDYQNGDMLLYFQREKLDTICMNYEMSSAGVVYNYYEYFFPSDRQGRPNELRICFHHDEVDDNEKMIYGKPECRTYVFDGEKFELKK